MTSEKLITAIEEANRFTKRAKALLEIVSKKEKEKCYCPTCEDPKERGAVRRSSMDLSRALSDLRR